MPSTIDAATARGIAMRAALLAGIILRGALTLPVLMVTMRA
jgi:hypothetical protein